MTCPNIWGLELISLVAHGTWFLFHDNAYFSFALVMKHCVMKINHLSYMYVFKQAEFFVFIICKRISQERGFGILKTVATNLNTAPLNLFVDYFHRHFALGNKLIQVDEVLGTLYFFILSALELHGHNSFKRKRSCRLCFSKF